MYVVDERLGWIRLIFKFRGGVLPRIWQRVASVTFVATISCILYAWDIHHVSLTPVPFQLVGVALGIFLGFRNASAYDRFWEGRKLWGQLVNTSRSYARQLFTFLEVPKSPRLPQAEAEEDLRALRVEMLRRHVAFVHALRLALRGDVFEELARWLPRDELATIAAEPNGANAILFRSSQILFGRGREYFRSEVTQLAFDQTFGTFEDVQGACERIRSTPVPFSYTVLIHQVVALYCVLLPFGLVQSIGFLTPLVVLVVGYAFFGLDAIGDELENPFGADVNDLPLLQLSTMIEANMAVRSGDAVPKPIEPVDSVLL